MGCQPTEDDLNESDYGPKNGTTLTGENANYDWGVYNPISNGRNKEGLWRTPSMSELNYLLKERPNAKRLKLRCVVCEKEGFVLLPDDFWDNRLRIAIDITSTGINHSKNKFDAKQWEQLEALGVVFFPRSVTKMEYNKKWAYNSYGKECCWTSNKARRAGFDGCDRYDGCYKCPVRLIQDVK